MTREALWQRLAEADLVKGELPAASDASKEARTPWPVRAMLGVAGWLGAIFLLFCAGLAFSRLFDEPGAALPLGALCCLGAFAIFAFAPNSAFGSQFAFAVSLAGQGLLMTGLYKMGGNWGSAGTYLVMAVVEGVLAFAMPNYVHRVATTVAANFLLLAAVEKTSLPWLALAVTATGTALVWSRPGLAARMSSLWEPIGYGFTIALLPIEGALIWGPEFWHSSGRPEQVLFWFGPVAVGMLFLYVVWELVPRAGGLAIAAAVVVGVCGVFAPGISASLLVVTLGFANGKRVLVGLGLIGFLGYLAHFYYQLSMTFLMKSAVLVGTGLVLLALRWLLSRFAAGPENVAHA